MSIRFTGVKVFSATMQRDRDNLGDKITEWLSDRPRVEVVEKAITQSSDSQYHCISITLFYVEKARPDATKVPNAGRSERH